MPSARKWTMRPDSNPVHIALSATHVYWTNAEGPDHLGTICRVVK